MACCAECLKRPSPAADRVEVGGKAGPLGPRRCLGCLGQGSSQRDRSVARASGLCFATGSVVAGTDPGP